MHMSFILSASALRRDTMAPMVQTAPTAAAESALTHPQLEAFSSPRNASRSPITAAHNLHAEVDARTACSDHLRNWICQLRRSHRTERFIRKHRQDLHAPDRLPDVPCDHDRGQSNSNEGMQACLHQQEHCSCSVSVYDFCYALASDIAEDAPTRQGLPKARQAR